MANVTITIPTPLGKFAGHQRLVEANAETLGQSFEVLGKIYPELVQRITTDEKNLRPFVNVFVGRANSRDLAGMATPLVDGQKITIMCAFAGG